MGAVYVSLPLPDEAPVDAMVFVEGSPVDATVAPVVPIVPVGYGYGGSVEPPVGSTE